MKRSAEIPSVRFDGGFVCISFDGGTEIRFPANGNSRLASGTPEQISNMQVTRFGIHWPDLDEDLSFEGLARGDYGQFANRPADRYPEIAVPPLSVAEPGPPPVP
jgi:hypothetical protein